MVLGKILLMIGKAPLATLLQHKVLGPMGLTQTAAYRTSYIQTPVLHSFSSERRVAIGIPAPDPFYEESTFWNAAWGTPDGAAETTNIYDMAKTAVAVGTGKLLSKSSYHAMTDPNLLGFGQKQNDCLPSCFTQVLGYNYGLGVVRSDSWILQNPLLGGYSATEAYLPLRRCRSRSQPPSIPGRSTARAFTPTPQICCGARLRHLSLRTTRRHRRRWRRRQVAPQGRPRPDRTCVPARGTWQQAVSSRTPTRLALRAIRYSSLKSPRPRRKRLR